MKRKKLKPKRKRSRLAPPSLLSKEEAVKYNDYCDLMTSNHLRPTPAVEWVKVYHEVNAHKRKRLRKPMTAGNLKAILGKIDPPEVPRVEKPVRGRGICSVKQIREATLLVEYQLHDVARMDFGYDFEVGDLSTYIKSAVRFLAKQCGYTQQGGVARKAQFCSDLYASTVANVNHRFRLPEPITAPWDVPIVDPLSE